MAEEKRQKLLHIKSSVSGKTPTAAQIETGEIAVNYNANAPFLALKDSSSKIRKISDDTQNAAKFAAKSVETAVATNTSNISGINEKIKTLATSADVNTRVSEIKKTIEDNEKVTAAGINKVSSDLEDYKGTVSTTYETKTDGDANRTSIASINSSLVAIKQNSVTSASIATGSSLNANVTTGASGAKLSITLPKYALSTEVPSLNGYAKTADVVAKTDYEKYTKSNDTAVTTMQSKLNGIESGANKTTITNNLTTTSTGTALDAAQGKVLNDKFTNGLYEANLQWGGKNFSGTYGTIDAAMVPQLGANRLAFISSDSITAEYSRDGGTTWAEFSAGASQRGNLFGTGGNLTIGGKSSSESATTNDLARITINTKTAAVYTVLKKFVIYISSNGASGCYCSIDIATNASSGNTWKNVANKVNILGWSGWNVINTESITTYGNSSNQYQYIRFTFGCTGTSASYGSVLSILQIMGFGGVGWDTPSNMAKHGHLYTYDNSQNANFPANVNAVSLSEGNTSIANKYAAKSHTHTKAQITDLNIPTVNDAKVTIKMNSAEKGAFTLNQSAAKEIDLGTVLTSHQTLKTINASAITGSGNLQVGTVTGIKMNGASKGTSGVVDLGTVITAHQDISGKQDKITTSNKLAASMVSGLATVATSGSYADLSNKPTIPTVGNGTISVTMNGASKGSFTTNQTTATTVALGTVVTGVSMNGTAKTVTNGVVDLGTVITAHQNISGKVDKTEAGVNAAINLLSTGASTPTDADYYISQYAGGGTGTTTYHRRPMSALWNYISPKVNALGYTKNTGDVTKAGDNTFTGKNIFNKGITVPSVNVQSVFFSKNTGTGASIEGTSANTLYVSTIGDSAARIEHVANPINDNDAANKSYVDAHPVFGTENVETTYLLTKDDDEWGGTITRQLKITTDGNYLYCSSDERLKDVNETLDVDLDRLSEIRKVRFSWKNDEEKKSHVGTIAQDVERQFPELVSENTDGYKSVSYDALSVVALAAIDKLNEKVKMLEARIAELEGEKKATKKATRKTKKTE